MNYMKMKLDCIGFKSLLFISIFIQSTLLYGQSTGDYIKRLNSLLPVSPNANSIMKYGDIPVNLSNGIPSIEIPVFTLNEKDLSMPIKLSYHASGIKVDEAAGWVGLGWSLSAGGTITREVSTAT